MSKIEVDNWFFSDKRYGSLFLEERLILLLIATHKKCSPGVLSSKSGLSRNIVQAASSNLQEMGFVLFDEEFFYLCDKVGKAAKSSELKVRSNEEYHEVVEHLYLAINRTAPLGAKPLEPKKSDYDQIRLIVERDGVPIQTLIGILDLYHTIPFWGEKFIVQSASGLRKHWLKIYESAQKHYVKNRIEKI